MSLETEKLLAQIERQRANCYSALMDARDLLGWIADWIEDKSVHESGCAYHGEIAFPCDCEVQKIVAEIRAEMKR